MRLELWKNRVMFSRAYPVWLFLLLTGYCLVGFYYRQVETDLSPMERVVSVAEEVVSTREAVNLSAENTRHRSLFEHDINTDFYQTIINNNIFAPLGTELNFTPKPGAALTLEATFVSENLWRSTAVIKSETTGGHHVLGIGGILGDFTVMKIQPKQVTLDHHGKKPVVLRLPNFVFLNSQRSIRR